MKKTEIVLLILTLIALGMNFFIIPFGGVLSIFFIGMLSMIYFAFGFAVFNNIRLRNVFKSENYSGIGSLRMIGAIGTGFSLSIVTIGILFKFQLWPGANANLAVGLLGLAMIGIIGLIKYFFKKSDYIRKILVRTLLFGGIGLFLFLTPMDRWVDIKYRNHPEYAEALKNSMADPNNPLLREKEREEYMKMH